MVSRSDLQSGAWWQDTAERVGRQVLQYVIADQAVILAAAAGGVMTNELGGVLLGALVAGAVTLLRRLAGITFTAGAPVLVRALERAVWAYAGALVAQLTVDGFTPSGADWPQMLVTAGVSALLALAMAAVTPPARDSYDLAA